MSNKHMEVTVGDTAEKKIMWFIDNMTQIMEQQAVSILNIEREIGQLQYELKDIRDERQKKKKNNKGV